VDTRLAARLILTAVITAEATAALARHNHRSQLFEVARARARELHRPLVVVGDPNNGLNSGLGPAYGCGDICLDLTGCPLCATGHVVDITRGPNSHVADNSAVVFVSCVIEYVSDVQAAWREVWRMAGGPENVFMVPVQPWTITSTLYLGTKNKIEGKNLLGEPHDACGAPPNPNRLCIAPIQPTSYVPVTTTRKVVTLAALGGLIAASFWPRRG
jgi:hypothetical protein